MDIENPDWNEVSASFDWRDHVPSQVRVIWSSFTALQKLALYQWAFYLSKAVQGYDR